MMRSAILALCTLSFASAQDVTGEWVATPQNSRALATGASSAPEGRSTSSSKIACGSP